MSHGVRTWSENGTLQMDTDSFTYQVLHSQTYTLSLGQVITVSIPGFDPAKCVAVILPTAPAPNTYSYSSMPFMSVGVGSVTVRSKHPEEPGNIGSNIPFRLLVTRYKN